jgi:hypothetical protein
MKIRNGFVSNSSSSSFMCDFCGYIASGWDISLSEAEMHECEHGHVFCDEHMSYEFEPETKECFEYFIELVKEDKFYNYNSWSNEKLAELLQKCIDEDNCTYDHIQELIDEEEDFETGYFEDCAIDTLHDYGIPEEFCPVCKRAKELANDEDFKTYKELYKKFEGINPEL